MDIKHTCNIWSSSDSKCHACVIEGYNKCRNSLIATEAREKALRDILQQAGTEIAFECFDVDKDEYSQETKKAVAQAKLSRSVALGGSSNKYTFLCESHGAFNPISSLECPSCTKELKRENFQMKQVVYTAKLRGCYTKSQSDYQSGDECYNTFWLKEKWCPGCLARELKGENYELAETSEEAEEREIMSRGSEEG